MSSGVEVLKTQSLSSVLGGLCLYCAGVWARRGLGHNLPLPFASQPPRAQDILIPPRHAGTELHLSQLLWLPGCVQST